jgi:type II secretory pathway pseudopilin PulG
MRPVPMALDTNQAQTISVLAIVAIVVVGLLLSIVLTKIIARILLAAAVIALGLFLWTQRQTIEQRINRCDSNVTFLGIDLTLSSSAEQRCAQLKTR